MATTRKTTKTTPRARKAAGAQAPAKRAKRNIAKKTPSARGAARSP